MYAPRSYAEDHLPTLYDFIDAHPLATVVTASPGHDLIASHVPLVLERVEAANGVLRGHIARANPHAQRAREAGATTFVIFTGADAYITPSWYATKVETDRVVPTWNYIAVHVYGALQLHDDAGFLLPHLEMLTHRHEAARLHPWQVSDAPDDFIAQQMKAIVGIEFQIERIEGKWKMSQNRSDADIDGVIRGLDASSSPRDREVSAIVQQRRPSR